MKCRAFLRGLGRVLTAPSPWSHQVSFIFDFPRSSPPINIIFVSSWIEYVKGVTSFLIFHSRTVSRKNLIIEVTWIIYRSNIVVTLFTFSLVIIFIE